MSTPEMSLGSVLGNELLMRQMVENIDRINQSVTLLTEKLTGIEPQVRKITGAVGQAADSTSKAIQKNQRDLEALTKASEKSMQGFVSFAQKVKGALHNIGLKEVQQGIEKIGSSVLQLQQAPDVFIRSMVRQIPYVGALLESTLNSLLRDDRFKTMGRQALMVFRGTTNMMAADLEAKGNLAGTTIKRLESDLRISNSTLANVHAAMAKGGLQEQDRLRSIESPLEGFKNTIEEQSIALDQLFGLASGSSMGNVVQAMKATSSSIEEAHAYMRMLGEASRGSGLDVQQFTATILQMTSALRMQGSEVHVLTSLFQDMKAGYQNMYVQKDGRKITDTRAGELTTPGAQDYASWMAGVARSQQGAYIAAQIAEKVLGVGHELSPIAARQALESGFQAYRKQDGSPLVDPAYVQALVLQTVYNATPENKRLENRMAHMGEIFGMSSPLVQSLFVLFSNKNSPLHQASGLGMINDEQVGALAERRAETRKSDEDMARRAGKLNVGYMEDFLKKIQEAIHAVLLAIVTSANMLARIVLSTGEALIKTIAKPGNAGQYLEWWSDATQARLMHAGQSWLEAGKQIGDLGGAAGTVFKQSFGDAPELDLAPWSTFVPRVQTPQKNRPIFDIQDIRDPQQPIIEAGPMTTQLQVGNSKITLDMAELVKTVAVETAGIFTRAVVSAVVPGAGVAFPIAGNGTTR